ncbi:MAG TPA: MBL fold metallo-hydrolase, partial [Myxococcaceae bacterium]|nr:MBL fold metallo-hydrolase [Myxococcaceae bacterium]
MSVELRKAGLHLSGTELWFDANRKSDLSFVSHAHADHIARHARVIATAATLRLMQHRLGKLHGALPVPYRRPFDLGRLVLELLPAGHVLGSAQLRVIREDGTRIVYTGDINFTNALTAEPAEIADCDVLVIESTFGHPRYVFPPRAELFDRLA